MRYFPPPFLLQRTHRQSLVVAALLFCFSCCFVKCCSSRLPRYSDPIAAAFSTVRRRVPSTRYPIIGLNDDKTRDRRDESRYRYDCGGNKKMSLLVSCPRPHSSSTPWSLTLCMATSSSSSSNSNKEIYGIRGSGWTSPKWNWGYAVGTGHDCAKICRARYDTTEARADLVENLLSSSSFDVDTLQSRDPPFEEVKLILALAWQKGRWDGSDGGMGGYGDVLAYMADAQRYEVVNQEMECSKRLVQDMKERFHLIASSEEEMKEMKAINVLDDDDDVDVDAARRKCAGLVLRAMGFIENGL